MDTAEFCRIQLRLHRTQGLSYHWSRFARVEVHVFVVGFNPINLVSAQESDATAGFDHEAIKVLRLVFDIFKQSAYLHSPVVLTLGPEPLFGIFDRVLESRLIE